MISYLVDKMMALLRHFHLDSTDYWQVNVFIKPVVLMLSTRQQEFLECRSSAVLPEDSKVTRARTDLRANTNLKVVQATQQVRPAGTTQSATLAARQLEKTVRVEGLTSTYHWETTNNICS